MPFDLDEDAVMKSIRASDGFKDMEARATELMRSLVRQVNATHADRPVDEVDTELRIKFSGAGVEPKEPVFSEVVTAISINQLTE